MRTFLQIIALVILFSTFIFSQTSSNFSPLLTIDEVDSFFRTFTSQKEPPKRGEFETKEEYQNRLPKPYDTSEIVYLKLLPDILGKSYEYNIDNQILTFFGGKKYEERGSKYDMNDGTPIEIYTNYKLNKEYIASNSFGKTVTVKDYYYFSYVLNFLNLDDLPESIYDSSKNAFHFSLNRIPKEAEKISRSVFLIVGVKLISPRQSSSECTFTIKPTIDRPIDAAYFLLCIDANFKSLLLYDENSKQIISRYDF